MIQPIEKKNIADLVFEKMLDMIVEGSWKQGEMIPSENELREAFSVSRSTVRQAVQRLSALGIVRSRQGKGTYVERLDTGFYLNLLVPSLMLSGGDSISILEFTKSIQAECVRIVAQRASDDEIGKLAEYLEQMRCAGDYESYFHFDMGYHSYLAQLTGNPLFIKALEIVENLLHVYLRDIVAFHGSKMSMEQHMECFEALQARDTERAVRIMLEHYDMLLNRMKDWLKWQENCEELPTGQSEP